MSITAGCGLVEPAAMRISTVDITVAFCVASPNLALKAIDYFVDLRNRYISAGKTKVDARTERVLEEREQKAAARNFVMV